MIGDDFLVGGRQPVTLMMKWSTPECPTKTMIIKTLEKLPTLNQLATLLGMGRSWQLKLMWAHWCFRHWQKYHGSVRTPQVVTQEAFRELRHPKKKHVPLVFLSQTPPDQRGRRGTEELPSSSLTSSPPTVRSGATPARVFPEMQDDFIFLLEECTQLLHPDHQVQDRNNQRQVRQQSSGYARQTRLRRG